MEEVALYRISLNDESYDIQQASLTPFHLAVLFGIDEASVVLKESYGDRVYFPENGVFNNVPNTGLSRYTIVQHAARNNHLSNIASTNRSNGTDLRAARTTPFIGRRSTQCTSEQNFSSTDDDAYFIDLKIRRVIKSKSGKLFPCQNWDMRICRNEAKLNIINGKIKEKFGPQFVICDADGLPIPNSLKYNEPISWGFSKSKSQKPTIWYVAKETEILSDVEDDDVPIETDRKRRRMSDNDVRSLKKAKEIVLSIDKMTKLEALFDVAKKIFTCSGQCGDVILKNPITCRKCGQVIFCEPCKDKWLAVSHASVYDQSNSTAESVTRCPCCRSVWNFAQGPFQLKGFDDFLKLLRAV